MKILIAGMAKSGTTGLMYLISNSTERPHRLLMEPGVCPPEAKSTEADVLTKVIINPQLDASSFSFFEKKITLVRDPRDRLVSGLLYAQYNKDYLADDDKVRLVQEWLQRKEENPSRVSIKDLGDVMQKAAGKPDKGGGLKAKLKKSFRVFDDYVDLMPDALLYKYEDFVAGLYAPVEEHLGMAMLGEAKVPNRLNRVERTKGYGDWRNWFTEEDVEMLKPVLSPWLEKYGYDATDWTLNESPTIDSAHCSGYFLRLVAECRAKPRFKAMLRKEKTQKRKQQHVDEKNSQSGDGDKNKHQAKIQVGHVQRVEPNYVAGWAIGDDPAKPVEVELLVNGVSVDKAVANKPRPALRERGLHPTGHCGFVFRLGNGKELKVGDEVVIRPLGTHVKFRNLPRKVENR